MGNKIDKPNRVIDKETAQNYAESMNVEYFETSAKENKNIDELFVRMTELILKYKNNEEPEEQPVTSMFLPCCLLLICSWFDHDSHKERKEGLLLIFFHFFIVLLLVLFFN